MTPVQEGAFIGIGFFIGLLLIAASAARRDQEPAAEPTKAKGNAGKA